LYTEPRPSSNIERQLAAVLAFDQYVEADSASPNQAAMWRLRHSGALEENLTWFDGKPHAQVSVRVDREAAQTLRSARTWRFGSKGG